MLCISNMDQQTFELSSAEIDVSRDAFDVPAVAPKIEVLSVMGIH